MTEQARPIPRATYRLQLSKAFTFKDVEAIAGYLGKLGISHAYLSPILQARTGSTHGYDTVDHRGINPELGTVDEFRQMARTLRVAGVSIILDIVPNHMGIGGDQKRSMARRTRMGPAESLCRVVRHQLGPSRADPQRQDPCPVPQPLVRRGSCWWGAGTAF